MAEDDVVAKIDQSSEPGRGFFLLGLMLGGAVGAALALLYAPRPGAQMRQELADRSGDWRSRVGQDDDVPPTEGDSPEAPL